MNGQKYWVSHAFPPSKGGTLAKLRFSLQYQRSYQGSQPVWCVWHVVLQLDHSDLSTREFGNVWGIELLYHKWLNRSIRYSNLNPAGLDKTQISNFSTVNNCIITKLCMMTGMTPLVPNILTSALYKCLLVRNHTNVTFVTILVFFHMYISFHLATKWHKHRLKDKCLACNQCMVCLQ